MPRELYTSPVFRAWFRDVLPNLRPTIYSTHGNPFLEAQLILGRFAARARLTVEPDETTPGDLKLLGPKDNWIWELKTGDVRIFGWFHAHDYFVANTGDDATCTKSNGLYDQHIASALKFLSQTGLCACPGDHRYVITL